MNDGLMGISGALRPAPYKRNVQATVQMLAATSSATYTLDPPVNKSRTQLINLGFSSSGADDSVRIGFNADGSAVTINRENATAIAANNVTQSFQVIEVY